MASKKCGKCDKTVYQAEWVQGLDQYWHKNCWRCSECQKAFAPLDNSAKQKDKILYCKKCHEEKFGAHANVAAPRVVASLESSFKREGVPAGPSEVSTYNPPPQQQQQAPAYQEEAPAAPEGGGEEGY